MGSDIQTACIFKFGEAKKECNFRPELSRKKAFQSVSPKILTNAMSIQLDQVKEKARRIARRIMWIALAGFLLFGIGYYFYRTYTVSEGSRSGTLFKISKKGWIFKTYEGQLQLAGSVLMNTQSTWEFSAENSNIYGQLQQMEGKPVKCYYHQIVNAFPWQGDTDYLVYKVELVQ